MTTLQAPCSKRNPQEQPEISETHQHTPLETHRHSLNSIQTLRMPHLWEVVDQLQDAVPEESIEPRRCLLNARLKVHPLCKLEGIPQPAELLEGLRRR